MIVAALEWVAWRDEPHYGSGLPPRYYVPQVNLPPAQPLEQVPAGYPEARATRHRPGSPRPRCARRCSASGRTAAAEIARRVARRDRRLYRQPPRSPSSTPGRAPRSCPLHRSASSSPILNRSRARTGRRGCRAAAGLHPAAGLGGDRRYDARCARAANRNRRTRTGADPARRGCRRPSLEVELARSVQGVARYSLDPLGDAAATRRFGRGSAPEPDAVEVPARPEGVRALPGRTTRQD